MKTILIITLSIGMRSFCGGCPEDSKHAGHEKNVIEASLGADVASAIERGNKALISRQHADDGSWGGDDVKVQSSHKSDYPVAISSLAYLALMATAPENKDALRARKQSLQFILDTIDDGRMKNTRDNTPKVHERDVWSQGFSLFVLSRLLEKQELDSATTEEVRRRLTDMVAALTKTQQADGGWTYDRGPSESFLTSTVLIGLGAAREVGIEIPDSLIDKPRQLIERQSNPGHFVAYQGVPKELKTDGKVRDSTGRSVQLELALLETGKGSVKKLEKAVETYFKFRERVDKVRDLEEGCHQPPYRIGTFYCFYGHFYLAQALQVVGDDTRHQYFPVLQKHFVSLQKPDGHWIDSRDHCGESYGTAMGLLVLSAPLWAK
jgi:hypothetical protein